MSLMTVFTVTHRRVGSPEAKLVLTMLAAESNADWVAQASVDHLATMAEVDPGTVRSVLEDLRKTGLVGQATNDMWLLDEAAINALPSLRGDDSQTTGVRDV